MNIRDIKEKLKKDERNKSYSKRGIDPIFQVNKDSKILIIGQAPGKRVEETGILFNDKSGERLVDWLGIDIVHFVAISSNGNNRSLYIVSLHDSEAVFKEIFCIYIFRHFELRVHR